jgi:hypothetical protein
MRIVFVGSSFNVLKIEKIWKVLLDLLPANQNRAFRVYFSKGSRVTHIRGNRFKKYQRDQVFHFKMNSTNMSGLNYTFIFANSSPSDGNNAETKSDIMKTTFGLIAALSFFGNLFLCVVMLRKCSMLKKAYNILIFNLAVADTLTGKYITLYFLLVSNKTWICLNNLLHWNLISLHRYSRPE